MEVAVIMRSILLATAIVLLASGRATAQLPDFPFIYAQGEAKLEVAPDTAILSFTIQSFEAEAGAASKIVADRTTEVLKVCEQQGIPAADLAAYELGKRAVRKQSDNSESLEILGYEISRTFQITIRQLDKYPQLVSAIATMPNVTDPETSFDIAAREKVEAELVGQACAKAREQAELMAKGAGATLGPIHAVSSTSFGNLQGRFGFAYGGMSGASSAGPEPSLFVPSTITITETVFAIYRLEAK